MAEIDLCPRCQAPLKFNGAKSCDCGWRKRERAAEKHVAEHIPVPCCYAGCPHDATIRYQTKTGWADMCKSHYLAYTLAECKEYNKARGLETPLQQRRYVKDHAKHIGRERQPGQDDEEVAA